MSLLTKPVSIPEFVESGDSVLRLLWDQAGRIGDPDDTVTSEVFGGFSTNRAPRSVAIGPMSDVDQCELQVRLPEQIKLGPGVGGGGQKRDSFRISLQQPMDFSLRGPNRLIQGADGNPGITGAVQGKGAGYTATFFPDGSTVAAAFRDTPATEGQLFEPFLELYVAFDERRVGIVNGKRHAKRFRYSAIAGPDLATGTLWRFKVPVFGRQHVRTLVRADALVGESFTIDWGYISLADATTMRESVLPAAPVVLAAAGGVVRFTDEPRGLEDFFEIRILRTTAGAGATLYVEAVVSD